MHKLLVAAIACVAATSAFAQEDARKMTREELLSFLPGTKVTHTASSGSLHRWNNEPDGTLVANTDNKKYGNALGTQSAASRGTWKVNDEGKYCIQIDWRRELEKWCAQILKSPDGIYYLNVVDAGHKIEFAK
jgi:hypothetical protein